MFIFPAMLAMTGCQTPNSKEPLKIAVSKLGKNYENWLLNADSTVIIHNMYHLTLDSAITLLNDCQGLLITGGEDVYPGWYNNIDDTARCEGFDMRRDTLEINLIKKALELKMPIVGICRGHQITNVVLGGTLIVDIPTEIESDIIHRCPVNPINCHHNVELVEGSMIKNITGQRTGTVTTYHHQAVDVLAPGLSISARSADGIVEAIEWKQPEGKSFLLGTQWHPERMVDYPELSKPIAARFLLEARSYMSRN